MLVDFLTIFIFFPEINVHCLDLAPIEGVAISLARRENNEGVGRNSLGH